ncbi:MAG TPA: hypothetical protein VMY42_10225 [Thermoguttaceae bacterium]|nr:hypothetical protein [Thermoguttaceae bacterium]
MKHEPANADPALDEELMAYLDGELDADDSQRIEQLLASDAEARLKLQRLERTWELLDELKTPQDAGELTKSTLEMVAAAAEEDVARSRAEIARGRRRRGFLGGACLLAVGVAGFFLVRPMVPNPNRQLLEDLPLLEHLAEYRQLDDVDFLHLLWENGLFLGAEDAASEVLQEPDDSLAGRRRRIENMSPAKQDELRQHRQWFEERKPAEQQRLRDLHERLRNDPHADELRLVMRRYHQWLKTLPAHQRAELERLEPERRIERINEQLAEQARQPNREDVEGLSRWLEAYAARLETELMQSLPSPAGDPWAELDAPIRRWGVVMEVCARMSRGRSPWPSERDLADLREELSPITRAWLSSRSVPEQWAVVDRWIRDEILAGRFTPPEVEKDLDLFCIEELPDEQEARLIGYSESDMRRQLWRMYCDARYGPDVFFHRPSGGPDWPRRHGTPEPSRDRPAQPGDSNGL